MPDHDWIPENIGRMMYDSFKVLSFSIGGASETKTKDDKVLKTVKTRKKKEESNTQINTIPKRRPNTNS